MTARLPNVDGDENDWGTVLNDFLDVSHNADGTLQSSTVANNQVASGAAINPTKISGTAEVQSNKNQPSGYAPLDSSSKLPTANLPNVPIANIPTGTTSSTVAIGNDSRITGAVQNSQLPFKIISSFNGSTDGTAIMAALTALGGPGQVYLPAGTGILDVTIVLGNGQSIVGQGNAATILQAKNALNAPMVTNYNGGGTVAVGCGVSHLQLKGNKANQANGHGIEWSSDDSGHNTNHLIFDVIIENIKQDGFHASSDGEHRLIGVFAHLCGGNGFSPTYDTHMITCVAGSCGLAGFLLSHGSIRLSGCKSFCSGQVTAASGQGFHLNYGSCELTACEAQDNTDAGFLLDSGAQGSVLSGCTADSNSTRGSGAAPGFSVAASSCVIDGASITRGSGSESYQQNALLVTGTDNNIRLSHSAKLSEGASVGVVLAVGSVVAGNNIQFNGDAPLIIGDDTQGQTGIIAPSDSAWATQAFDLVANVAYVARFVPKRKMTITIISFEVITAAGSNDNVDVGIYTVAGAKIVSSGATAGKLNAAGTQTVAITPTVLTPGTVYYAAISCGGIGATAARLVCAQYADTYKGPSLFGTTFGLFFIGSRTASHPLPANISSASAQGNATMLGIRES